MFDKRFNLLRVTIGGVVHESVIGQAYYVASQKSYLVKVGQTTKMEI